jgi:hypothetical protein
MKAQVIIERGNDGTFGAYIGSDNVPYGILGDGKTAQEAKEDFMNSYNEMREYYAEIGKEFVACDFEFQYDIPSFLQYYSKYLSLAGMERLTGVNQTLLGHYIAGRRKPGPKTIGKIKISINEFGKELQHLEFA